MATSGDRLRELFMGYAKRDDNLFQQAAEAIVQDERNKNHRLLADELERILHNGQHTHQPRSLTVRNVDIPKDRERGLPLLDITEYRYDWNRLVLPTVTLATLRHIANEHYRRDLLAASGLRPTQRVLFYGPPGCGKTLTAQVLAGVLSYPLVRVRFDAVISSYLGETGANLRRIFDFVQRGRWVVLFDEFDSVSKDRDQLYEHGELKRVVNTLLQLMDGFDGESILIAATNYQGILDHAMWRRFEALIPFNNPDLHDRLRLFELFLQGFDYSDLNLDAIGQRTEGATGADIEWITVGAAKRAVLNHRVQILSADIEEALSEFDKRISLVQHISREHNPSNMA